MILKELPPPSYDTDEPFQMLVTDLGYSDYLGRLAIGKIAHGSAKRNDPLVRINADGVALPLKVTLPADVSRRQDRGSGRGRARRRDHPRGR